MKKRSQSGLFIYFTFIQVAIPGNKLLFRFFFIVLDVDECKVRNPCKNGAKCVNSVGGYSCQCPANYKGKHCDEGNNMLTILFITS